MNEENRPLVADEPVEFKNYLVDGQDFGKITNHFRGICMNIPHFIEESPKDVSM